MGNGNGNRIEMVFELLCKKVNLGRIGQVLPAKKVLVLAPHHDDEVLGCGGTILSYLEQKTEVVIIYLTDGRYGINHQNKAIREEEAILAWKDHNVTQLFWNYEDAHLHETQAYRKLIEVIQETKPDIIFTPWLLDWHSDHTVTGYFLYKALEQIETCPKYICFYEILSPLFANHTVNITKVMEEKLSVLKAYSSQIKFLDLMDIAVINASLRAKLLNLSSIKAAEAFHVCGADTFKQLLRPMHAIGKEEETGYEERSLV